MKGIVNATIFSGEDEIKGKCILVDDHKIIGLENAVPEGIEAIDLAGKNIAPGFIDIQINGGIDHYFSQHPGEVALKDIYDSCGAFGTPYILPTLISSPHSVILQAIEAIRVFKKDHPTVLGFHLEGPFINPEKRGAHNIDIIRKPTDKELDEIIEKGSEVIKVMTIAPECFTDAQLQRLLDSGIILSAGHSTMNYDEAQRYFSMGIHLVTHLYNAMTQLGHRECGTVGAVFDNATVYAPIILDGGHCHYAAARIAYQQKKDKLFLISDAAFLGRRKQVFDWKGLDIKMIDGFYRDKTGNLAGAAISMPEAINNAIKQLGLSVREAVAMATSIPSRAIKMDKEIGFIKPGYPAVFTIFNNDFSEVVSLFA